MLVDEMYVRGIQVNYYFICKTKLWLFSHNLTMENESDLVKLGRLLHLDVFEREQKEIHIGSIAIDAIKKGDILEIREVKKNVEIEINYEIEDELNRILGEIERICNGEMPKPEYKGQCRKCAYFEFCFS